MQLPPAFQSPISFVFGIISKQKPKTVKPNKTELEHSDTHVRQTVNAHLVRAIGLIVNFKNMCPTYMNNGKGTLCSYSLPYPTVIFNVDISSFANEIFHYIKTVSFLSGHMQGSHLMERKTLQK